MSPPPGHETGHPPPAGYTWGDYLAALVEAHGSLASLAWALVERSPTPDDTQSVERALRRLRTRGQRDGGSYGQKLLRAFGIPAPIEARLRWMGLYHSPFNDLPISMCLDQLRLWDRPPVSASRARLWVLLGRASVELRNRRFDEAAVCLRDAAGVPGAPDAARVEIGLAGGYLASRTGGDVEAALDAVAALLPGAALDAGDRACFEARLADQRAFQRNRAGDYTAALALYEALPDADVHPFASYRRDAGVAYGLWRAGRGDEALARARRACDHAGDGGYTRLRAMGLLLVARIGDDAGALARARAIAARLDDEELRVRADRRRP